MTSPGHRQCCRTRRSCRRPAATTRRRRRGPADRGRHWRIPRDSSGGRDWPPWIGTCGRRAIEFRLRASHERVLGARIGPSRTSRRHQPQRTFRTTFSQISARAGDVAELDTVERQPAGLERLVMVTRSMWRRRPDAPREVDGGLRASELPMGKHPGHGTEPESGDDSSLFFTATVHFRLLVGLAASSVAVLTPAPR